MQTLAYGLRTFWMDEEGPTAVEYAVMLALIILTVMVAVYSVGSTTSSMMDDLALKNALSNSGAS